MTQSLEALRMALKACDAHVQRHHNSGSWWNDPIVYALKRNVIDPALSKIAALEAASLSDQSAGDGWKMALAMEAKGQALLAALLVRFPDLKEHPDLIHSTDIGKGLLRAIREFHLAWADFGTDRILKMSDAEALSASHIPVDRRAVLLEAAEIVRAEQSMQLSKRGNNELDEAWQVHNYGAVVSANIYDAIRSLAASPSLANEKEGAVK